MKEYYVPHAAWIDGVFKRGGSKVTMSDDAAKYLVMSGTIEVPKEKQEKKSSDDPEVMDAELARIGGSAPKGAGEGIGAPSSENEPGPGVDFPVEVQNESPADAVINASEPRGRRGGRSSSEG